MPIDKTYHGNDDRNPNVHYVYMIYFHARGNNKAYFELDGEEKSYFVEKYGIGQEWDRGRRVRNQVRRLNKNPEKTVNGRFVFDYDLLNRNVSGRIRAKVLELSHVTRYYLRQNEMPHGQQLPNPD